MNALRTRAHSLTRPAYSRCEEEPDRARHGRSGLTRACSAIARPRVYLRGTESSSTQLSARSLPIDTFSADRSSCAREEHLCNGMLRDARMHGEGSSAASVRRALTRPRCGRERNRAASASTAVRVSDDGSAAAPHACYVRRLVFLDQFDHPDHEKINLHSQKSNLVAQ